MENFKEMINRTPDTKATDKHENIEVIEPGVEKGKSELDKQSDLDKQIAEAAKTKSLEEIRGNIRKENPESSLEREKMFKLITEKINEMREKVLEKKKGFMNKMFISKKEINLALATLAKAERSVNGMMKEGMPLDSIDLHTIKNKIKFASDVDLTGLPERSNKNHSAANSTGFGVMGK